MSPTLADAIAHAGPIELVTYREAPLSERLCRAIAGQQLSVKAAASIWGRVVASAAECSLIEHFAAAEPETLRACGLSAAKVKAIRAIAAATLAGELDADVLGRLETGDRTQRLTAIWGVGQWTADMINIFYFGDPDIWPEGDTTARKTLERLTSPRRKTIRTAARFAPYRSYLALYMWQQADAAPV
ncbi:MAG: DNA-3-methyladenine glycosylase 2 family protein [Leptolyngbya sp. SIO1E4]|nr:DNA-3-methyladenine glycosylase 2 family protein [Leptolyngbya sp. SIO1E4]